MNVAVIVGRITANPELRYTPNGTAVTRFVLAVDRSYKDNTGKRQTDFIPVQAWRVLAENISKYVTKGQMICVHGHVMTDTYKDKAGKNVTQVYVLASEVKFLDQPKRSAASTNTEPDIQNTETKIEISNDDLPF